jgi:O-methyltransferase involved in polyketide biosynthesis
VFLDTIEAGVGSIVNIGCGSDTRAERFRLGLIQRGIQVLECDQAEAIEVKRRVATRSFGQNPQLSYQAIDLNDEDWPALRVPAVCGGSAVLVYNVCGGSAVLVYKKTL